MISPDAALSQRIVIVGASLAGLRAAQALRAGGHRGPLCLVGAESHMPYDRPPLSKQLLAGVGGHPDVALGAGDLEAQWLLGDAATQLDLAARTVHTASGRALPFDGLVIATGSVPRRLPDLEPADGIFQLRTVDDALALRGALARARSLVIVGAGFVGVEVASSARALGVGVEVVSLEAPLAVAGAAASAVATALMTDAGVGLHVGRRVQRIAAEPRLDSVILDDGTVLCADAVLVAVGAAPVVGWLEGSGLVLDDGVVCDPACRALGAEGVVAAGDVACWPNARFGGRLMRVEHWTNAGEQAAAAATSLLTGDPPAYAPVPSFWSDHFGARLQSVGVPALADRFEIVEGSVADRRFAAAGWAGERLVGGVAYDMPRALVALRRGVMEGGEHLAAVIADGMVAR